MKRFIIMAAMAAAIGTVTACGQQNEPPAEGSKTGFALSFFRNVNSVTPSEENLIVSPYSAGVLLSMLEAGAAGETKVEFDNVLNGTVFKAEDLGGDDKVTVQSSNSVWISSNFSVRNRYVDVLEKEFDAFVDTPVFSDPSTVKEINDWCSDHTSGKITEIIEKLSPDMVMVLVNALYFNAPWEKAFDPEVTREDVFHGRSGDETVPMMSVKANFGYTEYQGFRMVEIPYEGGGFAMYVVLSPDGMDIDSAIPYIGESMYDAAMSSLVPREIALTMPKYRLASSMVLNKTLQKMGLKTAFTPAADFKGISLSGPLQVDLVKQKCYIDVSEKGTEAAAVTSGQIRLTSVRPVTEFKVDKPFLFMIADREDKDILFAGKIVDIR